MRQLLSRLRIPWMYWIALGLASFVVIVWIGEHFLGEHIPLSEIVARGAVILIPVTLIFFTFWLFERRFSHFNIPLWWLIPLVSVSAGIIFLLFLFLTPRILGINSSFPDVSLTTAILALSSQLIPIIFWYTLLTLVFLLSGHIFEPLLRKYFDWGTWGGALRSATLLVIGIFLWVILLIVLSILDLLSQMSMLSMVFILTVLQRKYLISLLKHGFTLKFSLPHRESWSYILLALLITLIGLNLLETLRPAPTGFDDSTHYFSRVKLMAESQTVIAYSWPSPFETLATGMSIATAEAGGIFALSLGFYGLLLGTILIFYFAKQYFGQRGGLLASLILLSLPMSAALALFETKPDALLLPVMTAACWTLIEGWRQKHIGLWLASFFLLGLGVTVKLTALFFLPAFLLLFVFSLKSDAASWKSITRQLFLVVLCFSIPFSPWIGLRLVDTFQSPTPTPSLSQDIEQLLENTQCTFTGREEDFSRFTDSTVSSWSEVLTLPWDLTMNTRTGLFPTEIGFIFLALLPFILLAWLTIRQEKEKWLLLLLLSFLTGSVFLFWVMVGERVPWYFSPALVPAILLVALVVKHFETARFLYCLLFGLLLLGILSQSIVRLGFAGSLPNLRFIIESTNQTIYLDQVMPGTAKALAILNQSPEARIFMTSTRLWYSLDHPTERAFMDNHLDTFSCLINTYGMSGTAERLRKLGIRYFFFTKDYVRELERNTRPTFTAKIRQYTDFATQYLRPVWGSSSHMILEFTHQ